MKKFAFLLLVGMIVGFTSCLTYDNHGYPKKVTFSKNGGIKKFHSNDGSHVNFYISDYNATVTGNSDWYEYPDTITATCSWLTVKRPLNSDELIISAEANKTKKKRTLYIHIDEADTYGEITVKQKK